MLTTINKILAHDQDPALVQRLADVMGEEYDRDQEFNLADLAANRKANISDLLWLLGEEGKSALAVEFAIFCANSMVVNPAANAALEPELSALNHPTQGHLRNIANRMTGVNGDRDIEHNDPVWRKRRAVKMALLARASSGTEHAAHYAQYAFTWSYQVNKHGLQEKLIELLLEDK